MKASRGNGADKTNKSLQTQAVLFTFGSAKLTITSAFCEGEISTKVYLIMIIILK